MENQLIAAMLIKKRQVVPNVLAILEPDDLFRSEHPTVLRAIMRLYFKVKLVEFPAMEDELKKGSYWKKIDHRYMPIIPA